MICRIKELYEELGEYRDKNTISIFGQKLMQGIKKDFCEKYLEIIKLRTSDLTGPIAIFCTGMLLKLLAPILPFTSEKIREMFDFLGNIHGQKLASFFQKASKNYKTQLFMDIMDRFALLRERMGQPKHQKVDICFSASIDFLHYIKDHEDIVQKLVNAEKIEYIDKEKDLQKYETESIIDVVIGIKAISKPIKEDDGIYLLQQTLDQKQDELQKIRNITSRLSLDKKEKKAINVKKEEMNKLKTEIEKLEYEINKIKMNEK
jgi:valyl-tRNA synthetase